MEKWLSHPKRNLFVKIFISLLLSNIFFYFLLSESKSDTPELPPGTQETMIEAKLKTSFEVDQQVILSTRSRRWTGYLVEQLDETEGEFGKYIIRVSEESLPAILSTSEKFEILPYSKNLLKTPTQHKREHRYEIIF